MRARQRVWARAAGSVRGGHGGAGATGVVAGQPAGEAGGGGFRGLVATSARVLGSRLGALTRWTSTLLMTSSGSQSKGQNTAGSSFS